MRLQYKRLGDFIEACDEKDSNGENLELRGISNRKYFQKAKTNTIGVDLSKYRIVRTGQFAFNRATTRNGDRISIALSQEEDCIVSPSYRIFKSRDENILNSEYLMMWFRRPEFDRYARFKSHGSAHEFFDYAEMCEVELPIPSIEKQREIVKEYNTVVDRIQLNEKLNQKLEETAQAIHKEWFVDFEFPNEDGKPYRSSGGEMVWSEELDKEIPMGWKEISLNNLIDYNYSNYSKNDSFKKIYYLDTSSITENKIEELQCLDTKDDIIPSRAKRKISNNEIVYSTVRPNLMHHGLIKNPPVNMVVSTGFMVIKSKDKEFCNELLYIHLTNAENTKYLQAKAEMSVSTYPSIKPEDILELILPYPSKNHKYILASLKSKIVPIYDSIWFRNEENKKLVKIKALILSKMVKVKLANEKINS